MKEAIYSWIKCLAIFYILLTMLLHLVPTEKYQRYVRFFMGLVLMVMLVTPVLSLLEKSRQLPDSFSGLYQQEEQKRLELEMENLQKNLLETGMEEQLGENILEILKLHEKLQEGEYEERVKEALIQTGLDPDIRNRYVGQISGGQCQRANIARALVLRPELVICDEPVSSLDYSIRKQILHLLNELQKKYEMTYLLITHDLSNVPYLCKEVAIMYQGRVVEFIDHTDSLKETAVHPYTKDLFDSIPVKEPKMRRIGSQEKKIFSDTIPEQGCPYQNRCRRCTNICREHIPELTEIETGHFAACHML